MSDQTQSVDQFVQRFARTRELAARAIRENGDDVRALFGAGMAFVHTGDYAAAVPLLRRAAQLQPQNTHFHYELGKAEEYLGDFAAAVESQRRAIAATRENYRAHLALVQLTKQSVVSNNIDELKRLFEGPDPDGWRTLHIGHALAKTFEDFGDLGSSFAWLTRAKQRRREIHPYDQAREQRLTAAAIGAADAKGKGGGYTSREPIFVAGLPRSGTTLADRILSSHPSVTSAGEIGHFLQLFKRLSGSKTPASLDPDTFARIGEVELERLGRLYIESTRPLTGAAPHFVDKSPSNYLIASVILQALPESRIVCMRRHPLDSVLSNFKQIFPIDDRYYDYVYALESAAHKVVEFERAVTFLQSALPAGRFMVMQYEDLASEQDRRTRELVAFCGLPWDDRCLAFQENKAGVATPSAAQVRKPMYTSAVGRWRNYGALLDPAKAILDRAGLL